MSGLLAILIFFAASAIADARDLPLVRIGQSSITDVQVASIVTQQAGIFKKYGLDTELILLQGGPLTVQALISGSIDFADVAGPAVIGSQLAGAEIVSLLYQITGLTHSLFVRPDIQTAKDLKGKRVGVVRIGGLAEYIARYMLTEKLGLNPAEVKLVPVGGQAERIGAGRADSKAVDLALSLNCVKIRQAPRSPWSPKSPSPCRLRGIALDEVARNNGP